MLNKINKIKAKNLKQRIEIIKSKSINNYFDHRFISLHNQIINIKQEIELNEELEKKIINNAFNYILKIKEMKKYLTIKSLDKDLIDNNGILITFEESFNRSIKAFVKLREFKYISKANQFNDKLEIIKNSLKIKKDYIKKTIKKIANDCSYKKLFKILDKSLTKINSIKKILEFKKKDLELVLTRLENVVKTVVSNNIVYNIQTQINNLNNQNESLIKALKVANFYKVIGGIA